MELGISLEGFQEDVIKVTLRARVGPGRKEQTVMLRFGAPAGRP